MPWCAVKGCRSNSKFRDKSIKFHTFPKLESSQEQWLKFCGRDNLNIQHARICSVHFEKTCYNRSFRKELMGYCASHARDLRSDAVPTLRISDVELPTSPSVLKRKPKLEEGAPIKPRQLEVTEKKREEELPDDVVTLYYLEEPRNDVLQVNGHMLQSPSENCVETLGLPELNPNVDNGREYVSISQHSSEREYAVNPAQQHTVALLIPVELQQAPLKPGSEKQICEKCGKEFENKNKLENHKCSVSVSRPHECQLCEKKFTTLTNLKRHVRTHTGGNLYKCGICFKEFRKQRSLKIHSSSHGGCVCLDCGQVCASQSHVTWHDETQNSAEMHACTVCGEAFRSEDDLVNHSKFHSEQPCSTVCDICGEDFEYRNVLESHMEVHTEVKSHKCQICGEAFTKECELKVHILVHTELQFHECDFCSLTSDMTCPMGNHIKPSLGKDSDVCRELGCTHEDLSCEIDKLLCDDEFKVHDSGREDIDTDHNKGIEKYIESYPLANREECRKSLPHGCEPHLVVSSMTDHEFHNLEEHLQNMQVDEDIQVIQVEEDVPGALLDEGEADMVAEREVLIMQQGEDVTKILTFEDLSLTGEEQVSVDKVAPDIQLEGGGGSDTLVKEAGETLHEVVSDHLEEEEEGVQYTFSKEDIPCTVVGVDECVLSVGNEIADVLVEEEVPEIHLEEGAFDIQVGTEVLDLFAEEEVTGALLVKEVSHDIEKEVTSAVLEEMEILRNLVGGNKSDGLAEDQTLGVLAEEEVPNSIIDDEVSNVLVFEENPIASHIPGEETVTDTNDIISCYVPDSLSGSSPISSMELSWTDFIQDAQVEVIEIINDISGSVIGKKPDTNVELQEALNEQSGQLNDQSGQLNDQSGQLNEKRAKEFSNVQSNKKEYACELCGKKYIKRSLLVTHMLTHSELRPYECQICSKTFKTMSTLKLHMNIHSFQKPLECNICGKGFRRKYDLKIHMSTHTGGKFKCLVCGNTFGTKSQLKTHGSVHSDVRQYICDVCGKMFKRNCDLLGHLRVHTEPKVSSLCSICGEVFELQSMLNKHMEIHSSIKPFVCKTCGKAFKRKNELNVHMLTHSTLRPYNCHLCMKKFKSNRVLKLHIQKHANKDFNVSNVKGKTNETDFNNEEPKNGTVNKYFECDSCGKQYRSKFNFRKHLRTHSNINVPELEVKNGFRGNKNCLRDVSVIDQRPKSFRNKNLPELLKTTHEENFPVLYVYRDSRTAAECTGTNIQSSMKETQYQCTACCVGFEVLEDLEIHMKKHTEELSSSNEVGETEFAEAILDELSGTKFTATEARKLSRNLEIAYMCQYCSEKFTASNDLYEHILTHTDLQAYECSVCGETYISPSHLKKHVENSHSELSCKCDTCGEEFDSKELLEQHRDSSGHILKNDHPYATCQKWNLTVPVG